MNVVAIILAGGKGTRMSTEVPKQFLEVNGKTIIEHTIEVFENHSSISKIIVVMNEVFINRMKEIVAANAWKKVADVISGGKERYESSYNAIKYLSDCCNSDTYFLFHDAVRPAVNNEIIDRVVDALGHHDAVMTAIPSSDTLVEVSHDKSSVKNIPDRNFLMRVQTPQAFSSILIKKAYETALRDDNFICTDDCGVVQRYLPEKQIFIVKGDERNIKVTFENDLFTVANFLNKN